MKQKIIYSLFVLVLLVSCSSEKRLLRETEKQRVGLFKNPVEMQIAKLIKKNDAKTIHTVLQNNNYIIKNSYEYTSYSLLHLAVELQRVETVEELLHSGFNPNVKNKEGITPLLLATDYNQLPYNNINNRVSIVENLLDYGADSEICFDCYHNYPDMTIRSISYTPLMNSINNYKIVSFLKLLEEKKESKNQQNIESSIAITKVLVEKGNVDINRKTELNVSAAILALFYQEIEKAHYLIAEKHAIITEAFYLSEESLTQNKETYPVTLLRQMIYPLESESYKLKMEIVEEFKKQGVDYWAEPIPENIQFIIKNLYPNSWEDFLQKY